MKKNKLHHKFIILLLLNLLLIACETNKNNINLYIIKENKRYGFINYKGIVKIKPIYISANIMRDGLSPVSTDRKSINYVNRDGYLFNNFPNVSKADVFSDGMARISINNLIGYINTKGKIIVPPIYDKGGIFTQGLAPVISKKHNFIGYINNIGERVLSLDYDALGNFHENRAWVIKNKFFGVINMKGKLITPLKFLLINDYHNGLAKALSTENHLFGYINKSGHWQILPKYYRTGDFAEKRAIFYSTKEKLYGYINIYGQIIIPPKFIEGGDFHSHRAWVKTKKRLSYINRYGKFITNRNFIKAYNFYNYLAPIITANKKNGYINRYGKIVWEENN